MVKYVSCFFCFWTYINEEKKRVAQRFYPPLRYRFACSQKSNQSNDEGLKKHSLIPMPVHEKKIIKKSTEPDLNQRPKDIMQPLQSSALPLSYRWIHDSMHKIFIT